jgi:hypothetical protein
MTYTRKQKKLMDETSTNYFNTVTHNAQMEEQDVFENLDADDLIFYHSIRAELDLLKRKPKLQTIHYILDHSKSFKL